MSKIALSGNSLGSGTLTIAAPNTNTDRTLVLPDEAGTVVTSATGGGVYSRDNILGTVSQSSGVPTGAIIERGSNANGEFVKYADGTQVCYTPNRVTVDSSAVARQGVWTFPSPFLSATSYTAQFYILESSTGTATINTSLSSVNQTNLSATVEFVVSVNNNTSGFTAFAIGRWY
jgi:phage baseplate assembly protein gpV